MHAAWGLCRKCYRAKGSKRGVRELRTNTCGHPEREHSALGKCQPCYMREYGRRKYGLTDEQLAQIEARTSCDVCSEVFGRSKDKMVDHCHVTGRFRGVLCFTCNCGIGQFSDSVELLCRAAEYLAK